MDFTELLSPIAAMPAMTPDEERVYVLKTEIYPQLDRWGFEVKFLRPIAMPLRQKKVYAKLRDFIRSKSAIVALVGIRGVGKTTMTAQLAMEYAQRNYESKMQEIGRPVLQTAFVYFKTRDLVSRFKSLFADYGSIDTERLILAFDYIASEHEIIVIDEMHECEDHKMMRKILTDMVDRRYARLKHTILISNQSPDDFSTSAGDSIISRLNEHGEILNCTWESFR